MTERRNIIGNIGYECGGDGHLQMVQLPTIDEQYQMLLEQMRRENSAWIDAARAKYAAGGLSITQLVEVEAIAARLEQQP